MSRFDFLLPQLESLRKRRLLRSCTLINSAQSTEVIIGGERKILFCSNNYLGLAAHPDVLAAARRALETFGHGSGASRLVSGTMPPHVELENRLAGFCRQPAALLTPSGWTANAALLSVLPAEGDLVLIDKLDHASIIDAVRACPARFHTWRRDNLGRLRALLERPGYNRRYIVTESVFSMDGDTAPLAELVELKKQFDAFIIVDEAHAFGCMGPSGAGLADQLGLLDEIDVFLATLSKAFGASGGIIASEQPLIDLLVNKARPFIYTTAPSPVNAAAALAALDIIENQPDRRARLAENTLYLRRRLRSSGIDAPGRTHIIPIIIGPEEKALAAADDLFEKGFYIPAIRPPTVPPGTSRLRISIQSEHTKDQLDALAEALEQLARSGAIPRL